MADDDDMPIHADVGNTPTKEPTFPNLAKIRALNEEMHEARALEMGLTPEEAKRHAKEDAKHWAPGHEEASPHED